MIEKKIMIIIVISSLLIQGLCLPIGASGVTNHLNRALLLPHPPIRIESDAGFSASNGVIAGDGSSSNPFIIENWSINASQSDGIVINYTTVYFVIMNCEIYDGHHNENSGIVLNTVKHGVIKNISLLDDDYGMDIYLSNNLILENLIIINCSKGVYITQSADVQILNSKISNDYPSDYCYNPSGITISGSQNVVVINCTIDNDNGGVSQADINGIVILYSTNVTIEDCYIFNNTRDGIYVSGGIEIKLLNCHIFNNGIDGIGMDEWSVLDIENNQIYDNIDDGIRLWIDAGNTRIRNNNIYGNAVGIIIGCYERCILENNNIHDNWGEGVALFGEYFTLYNNTISHSNSNLYIFNPSQYDFIKWEIPSNNTVDGRPIYFWTNRTDLQVPSDAGLIGLINCRNIKIEGADLAHNSFGIMLMTSLNISVVNSTITDVDTAIFGDHSNISIISNKISKSAYGIFLSNCMGFLIQNNDLRFEGEVSENDRYSGIDITDSITGMIINNHISGSYENGISIENGRNISVQGNDIVDSKEGIYLGSDSISIKDNVIINMSKVGIYIYGSNDTIENNTISDSDEYGIDMFFSEFNSIKGNKLFSNEDGIILIGKSNNNIIQENIVLKNNIGIVIKKSNWYSDYGAVPTTNTIYNNYFENNINYRVDLSNNFWSIEPKHGRNIVGGNYLGGNYWSDFYGSDNNGDFLADVKYPYGPGDMHPLLKAPPVIDQTKDNPRTGEAFDFNVSVFLKNGTANVSVEYWLDTGPRTILGMNQVEGDLLGGDYNRSIMIPLNAMWLHYIFIAISDHEEVYKTYESLVLVRDLLPPNIMDVNGTPTTGDNFLLQFNISDNIEIKRSFVIYWFDQQSGLGPFDLIDSINISIPMQASILHYSVTAVDRTGNVRIYVGSKDIIDNRPPTIVDVSGIPQTGDAFELKFEINDNRGIMDAEVVYWSKNQKNVQVLTHQFGYYHCTIIVPKDSIELNYTVTAWDFHSNSGVYNGSQKVKDTLKPTISDLSKGTANKGDKVTFTASVKDNIDIKSVNIYYWVDGSGEEIQMRQNGDIYSARIWVPDNCHNFTYIIYSKDGGGNIAQTSPKTLELHPSRTSIDYNWIIGIIICVIALVPILIYYKRSKIKEHEKKNRP